MNPKDDTCGQSTPILQKRGLTAAPLKPARKNLREILRDTEALLEDIDTCLGTKPGNQGEANV